MRPIRIFHTESFRLAAAFAVLFAGATILLIGAVYVITADTLTSEFRSAIDADIGALNDGYRSEGISEVIEIINQRTATPGFYDSYLLQDKTGKKLAGNLAAMPPVTGLRTLPWPGNSPQGREHPIMGKGVILPDGSYMFVAQDTHPVIAAREDILTAFGFILCLTIVLSIGGGILFSTSFLRRIDAITQTCRAIVGGQFAERVPTRGTQNELDLLAGTINAMLDRISALMDSLRQVSSDVAHDLRTPVTHLRQRLDIVRLRAQTPEEYAAAVEHAIADTDEILAVFSALLRISQIESGTRLSGFLPVNIGETLRRAVDIYAAVAEDNGQTLTASLKPDILVNGDAALLMQMFSNLIENAIRHTPRGTDIDINMTLTEDRVTIRICDSGPGIPAEERDKVFRRFYRIEGSRGMPGNGLGLALVAAIADLHGMDIALSGNNPGLCVTLGAQRLNLSGKLSS